MQLTGFQCRHWLEGLNRCGHRENCTRCHIAGRCEFCTNRYTKQCKECGVKDMKKARGTLPTRRQKEIMDKAGLVPDNWLVIGETDARLYVRSKRSGQTRYIETTT